MTFKKICLLSLLGLSLSACSIFSPYGTSNIPDPAPLTKINPAVFPQIVWHTNVGSGSDGQFLRLTPMVVNDIVYTIDEPGHLVATSKAGQKLWSRDFKNGGKSGIDSDGTVVSFVDGKGILYLISASKPDHILWQVTLSSQALASPTVLPNLILVKTIDGNVTAFDRATGEKRWQYQHSAPDLILRASSAVLVDGQTAYVGFSDGKVIALNVTTGDEIWEQRAAEPQGFAEVERMVDIDAKLILQGGRLFVATYQGQVAALNPSTGAILWQQANSIYANIATDNSRVFAVQADGTMSAYEQNTGKQLWQQKALAWRFLSGATVNQGHLVVGDLEGYLHYINPKTGELLGRILIDKDSAILNSPMLLGNDLVILDTKGHLALVRG